jgi:hypothetical protein
VDNIGVEDVDALLAVREKAISIPLLDESAEEFEIAP